jgi:hypothetical protein
VEVLESSLRPPPFAAGSWRGVGGGGASFLDSDCRCVCVVFCQTLVAADTADSVVAVVRAKNGKAIFSSAATAKVATGCVTWRSNVAAMCSVTLAACKDRSYRKRFLGLLKIA